MHIWVHSLNGCVFDDGAALTWPPPAMSSPKIVMSRRFGRPTSKPYHRPEGVGSWCTAWMRPRPTGSRNFMGFVPEKLWATHPPTHHPPHGNLQGENTLAPKLPKENLIKKSALQKNGNSPLHPYFLLKKYSPEENTMGKGRAK